MKRLILDFEKDGKEYVYKLYHPLQDSSDGFVTYSSTPKTFIPDIVKSIQDYLQVIPTLADKDKGLFQSEPGWYLIHQSKLQAYEITIQVLTEERDKLSEQLKNTKDV